jgi:hypothetical protein
LFDVPDDRWMLEDLSPENMSAIIFFKCDKYFSAFKILLGYFMSQFDKNVRLVFYNIQSTATKVVKKRFRYLISLDLDLYSHRPRMWFLFRLHFTPRVDGH